MERMDAENLIKLFRGVNRRLSNIIRYNNDPRIKGESVAEHSYFVTFYVMIFGDIVDNIDMERAMKLALIHDIEESISGDLPHTVKVKYPELNLAFEKMNLEITKEIFKGMDDYVELWKEVRECKTKEAKLVLLADIVSAVLYSDNEVKMGNIFMKEIHENGLQRLSKFIDDNREYAFVWKMFNYEFDNI